MSRRCHTSRNCCSDFNNGCGFGGSWIIILIIIIIAISSNNRRGFLC
jgi:hypothetical protein